MNDKTTAALKAELRAEREYLASGLPAFRARSSRERIREMETELEARGETLDDRTRSPSTGSNAPDDTRRHYPLTRWYAVGMPDRPGWPIPKAYKRHMDRSCGALLERETREQDIRELREEELAEHEPCLRCSG